MSELMEKRPCGSSNAPLDAPASWEGTCNQQSRFPIHPRLAVNRGFFLNRVPQEVAHTNEWQNMNANDKRVKARFGRETRFVLKPVCAAAPGATQEIHLHSLRNRLLLERLDEL